MNDKEIMHISEGELAQLTEDMDEMHHATLPVMQASVEEWAEVNRELRGESGFSRRRFLAGTGAVAIGGFLLAACGSDDKGGSASDSTLAGDAGKLTGDLAIAGVAASLENLAVGTYMAGIDAATKGKLGTVPPAVVTFATTAMAHHKDHADAWNAILTASKKQPVTIADPKVKPSIDAAFAKVTDVAGLAKLALELENVAAATYLNALGVITVPQAITTAASIQPVEMQHAAILNFVLGQYPVPDAFAKTDGARPPSDIQ